ncbi:carbohydrate-binding module family 13 protein [Macrolepiota fuliginosa MF-IS2]|uniref:Carbohydrate-binding module family 13 protein n=1 Tax=Macrolepiota fuliginosa MF-IS2 TaxID=1400762 RepID=A0A9P5X1L1_9AGAR|nr:carbohydrate-binding module family 13 protein [Macrolepiota fuliginosa MF-IS2]
MKFYPLSFLIFCYSALSQTALHPSGVRDKCLNIQWGIFANGTPVQIANCNGRAAQQWILSLGPTTVCLAGTEFCLDSTFKIPPYRVPMKIWECVDGAPEQQWAYIVTTAGGRLALANQEICLDLRGGDLTGSNPIQVWECANGVTNQIWTS